VGDGDVVEDEAELLSALRQLAVDAGGHLGPMFPILKRFATKVAF
jgi:hypothetical protein